MDDAHVVGAALEAVTQYDQHVFLIVLKTSELDFVLGEELLLLKGF